MKLYLVQVLNNKKYAGSEAAARLAKRDMLEKLNFGPRSPEGTIEQVEVPIGKVDLIEFLNKLVK